MPVVSTTKTQTGSGGGTNVTEGLTINLNESTALDTVTLHISLAYNGITYGGQEHVTSFLSFMISDPCQYLKTFTFATVPGAAVAESCQVTVPKSLGEITIENPLNVTPECLIDIPADANALFVVAFV